MQWLTYGIRMTLERVKNRFFPDIVHLLKNHASQPTLDSFLPSQSTKRERERKKEKDLSSLPPFQKDPTTHVNFVIDPTHKHLGPIRTPTNRSGRHAQPILSELNHRFLSIDVSIPDPHDAVVPSTHTQLLPSRPRDVDRIDDAVVGVVLSFADPSGQIGDGHGRVGRTGVEDGVEVGELDV